MATEQNISTHYTHGNLLAAIRSGIEALGKTAESVTVDDLGPVDEFHTGGRQATEHLIDQLGLSPDMQILDVGCGLGGPARFVASKYHCSIDGIDLTPEYVETGRAICEWVGLTGRVSLHQGSALSMPFVDRSFDGAYMLHVGMNIEDKARLFSDVHRVLRPGSLFGIYDIMKVDANDLSYPVPWATTAASSFVVSPAQYRRALEAAGFVVVAEVNRRDFAITFFDQFRSKILAAGGPPPLGLHLLMGKTAPDKISNMIQNVASGHIAPIELIVRKP